MNKFECKQMFHLGITHNTINQDGQGKYSSDHPVSLLLARQIVEAVEDSLAKLEEAKRANDLLVRN